MEQASFTVSSWQEQPIDNLNENFPVNQASAKIGRASCRERV